MELVSIGMPVYNDVKFIERAIQSILLQSYSNFEFIISDDCSTDGSAEICKSFAAKDSRIIYIKQDKNIGISKNMEFLLSKATGKYFMWAGNDDVWDSNFISVLKNNFDNNPTAVSSFCAYALIDENDQYLAGREFLVEDFCGQTKKQRLTKLIKNRSDGFGYGLFIRENILGVRFPVWWWINKKCAYNNIYPSLCFYLTKGEYVVDTKKALWFKRMKTEKNVNHKIPFSNNFFLCYLAFALRKINLVLFSLYLIIKADKGLLTAIKILPRIVFSWFIVLVFFNVDKKYEMFKTDKTVMI